MSTRRALAYCNLVAIFWSIAAGSPNSTELKLLSVVFRHADRAPDLVEQFPKDPYYSNSFFPEGIGGLTNQGKQRAYRLGEFLRKSYGKFLGDIYLSDSLSARSTDYERTKMCLQLVLSSLYPPHGVQRWNQNLDWQPIPTTYEKSENDVLMIPEECPNYLEERLRVENSPQVRNKIEKFRPFMDDLTKYTGKKISSPNDMYNLYHILTAEAAMNLTLPQWADKVFPYGKLLDGINLEYEIFSYNTLMRKLNGGMLLRKIMEDSVRAKEGSSKENRKIFLYSGHETNVAAVLQALGVYKPHVPEYTSAVIFELHKAINENLYYVKVLYYKGIPAVAKEQKLLGCDVLCPLNHFIKLLEEVTPTDRDMICNKNGRSAKNLMTNQVDLLS